MEGYVKLYRKLLDWEWFDDDFLFKLFVYCLLKANFTPSIWRGIEIPSGSFITSSMLLAERFNVSRAKIRYSLEKLIATNNITTNTTNKHTQINVVNWQLYQSQELSYNQQDNQHNNIETTNKKPTKSHSIRIKELEEFKEVKNLKECIIDNTQEIANFWNEKMKDTKIPTVRLPLTDTRKTHLKQRIEEMSLETIYEVVEKTYKSDFLRGLKTTFVGSFDFCFSSPNNFTKILEGNYDNQEIVVKPKNPLKDENVKQYGGTYL